MDDVEFEGAFTLDKETAQWLTWKAEALTHGNVGKAVAHFLHLAMREEQERRRLGLDDKQALPETSWTALDREKAIRAEPKRL